MDIKKEVILSEKIGNSDRKSLIKGIFIGAVNILIAFFLGEGSIFFGVTPFGFAYIAASSKNIVYIYIGLCLSALLGKRNATVLICSYTIVVLLRILSRIVIDGAEAKIKERKMTLSEIIPMLFGEHIFLRTSSAAIGAFTVGIYTLISGGFYFYDLIGVIIGIVFSALLTFVFYGVMGEEVKINEKLKFACLAVFIFCIIFCAKETTVLGISVSVAAAFAFTLYFSHRHGFLYGIVIGMCAGLAISHLLAPAFIFAAIVFFLLKKISVFFASASAALVTFSWGLFAEGISALTTLVPALVLVFTLYSAIDKLYFSFGEKREKVAEEIKEKDKKRQKEKTTFEGCHALGEEALDGAYLFDTEIRIKALCESFSSLSSLFFGLSERMKALSSADAKGICDGAFDEACSRCERREECWEKEYSSTSVAVNSLSSALMKSGRVTTDEVPAPLISRCMVMPDILDRINKKTMLYTQELLIGDKTEIFALDYEAVSELLAAAMVHQREEFEPLPALTKQIAEKISEKKLPVKAVIAYGSLSKRTVLVRGSEKHAFFSASGKIIALIEGICGAKMKIADRRDGRDEPYIVLTSAERYDIEYAERKVTAEGEEGFCGDTVSVFENSRGKFYSLISDGMGSGREAALTSGISSVFLTKMLGASAKCDVTLKMLGSFLRNKGSGSHNECSATVDLLEFDTVTGETSFYKAGAAPSYVWREKNLFKLRSNTVPLGIIKEVDVRKINFELNADDVVVMVSDGVTQSKDDCPWLFELLSESVGKESLAAIADMIVKRAKYEGSTDDISVIVMKVKEI